MRCAAIVPQCIAHGITVYLALDIDAHIVLHIHMHTDMHGF